MDRLERPAIFVLLIVLVAFGPLSTDVYLPALPGIGRAFATDAATVQLTLSVFLVGFALGMLAYGPLSDRFGRRPVLLTAIALYMGASLACAFAPTVEALIVLRGLQGLSACVGPVIARTVIRDIYGADRSAKVLSYVAMAMALAPAIGPILGGYITIAFGWRTIFLLLAATGLGCLAGVFLLLPETNREPDPTALQPARMAANFRGMLASRRYRCYLLVSAAGYSGLFSFISGSAFILIDGLGVSPDAYGLCFATVVAGYIVGSFSGGRLHGRISIDGLILAGTWMAMVAGLAGLALVLAGVVSVASVVGPTVLFFAGAGLMMPNAMAGAIGPYPRSAGAASSLLGFVQMALAAVVGVGVGQLQDGTPLAMAAAIAAVGVAALAGGLLLARPGGEAPPA